MSSGEVDSTTLKFVASISEEAQKRASREQKREFVRLVREKIPNLTCIGCGKEVEFIKHDFEDNRTLLNGYFWGGGLLVDRMGFGSTQHDMAKVAVLVCDNCVTEKGVSSSWLDKLHKHFDKVEKQWAGKV